ncbi:aspartyl-phosphate phosphatase Spo0E family protein [Desulfallas sp. Bu1-1]|jgi:tmRNA-binding protein|uniref:aspartyl-phosphate phosphatase Spo0E family protein n=1 Tax=Desulfallas sp. Bu1-1 TaxID=2787620 RepID=UPI00189FCDF6|nr:aspartyl-phosphate phosphatase Spo0E family protein [Desulfallas sp. Bu1-1]MBF7083439.1 aspartyl-phosphate phosphatase Spo0E family protein [Desulfallas sp. Bu1-1]
MQEEVVITGDAKMDIKKWGVLLVEIERERRKMYEITRHEPQNVKKLLKVSQKLDKLINQYQKEKISSTAL